MRQFFGARGITMAIRFVAGIFDGNTLHSENVVRPSYLCVNANGDTPPSGSPIWPIFGKTRHGLLKIYRWRSVGAVARIDVQAAHRRRLINPAHARHKQTQGFSFMKILMKTAITAFAITIAAQAQAVTFNLASDFSNVSNPNGPWSFTYAGSPLTHFAQPSDPNGLNPAAANGYWGISSTFNLPTFVLKTTLNGAAIGATNGDFLAGDVIVHSPNDGSAIAINWTAPTAGTASFASAVWYAHSTVQRSAMTEVFLNGVTSLGSVTVTNGIVRGSALTSLSGSNLTLASGDFLQFRFSRSTGQPFGSLTGIDWTVDFTAAQVGAVPEPATWGMMLLGFGLVGNAMRRRVATRVSAMA